MIPEDFAKVFRAAAAQAGWVARRFQGEVRNREKEGFATPEGSALTTADLAAQDVILLRLHEVFPDAAVDAEEQTETVRLFPDPAPGRPLIVVDPIDGTLNYIRGSRDFAVMGACMIDGIYQAAVIHFPVWEETYWAVRGKGCRRSASAITKEQIVRIDEESLPSRILTPSSVPERWKSAIAAAGFESERSRCSAVDASAPAIGRAAATVSLGRPSRRRTLGYLLTVEAGGVVSLGGKDWDGSDPDFLKDDAHCIVAGSHNLLKKMQQILD